MAIGGDGGCQHVCTTVRRRADAGGRRVSAGSGGGAPPPTRPPSPERAQSAQYGLQKKGPISHHPPGIRWLPRLRSPAARSVIFVSPGTATAVHEEAPP